MEWIQVAANLRRPGSISACKEQCATNISFLSYSHRYCAFFRLWEKNHSLFACRATLYVLYTREVSTRYLKPRSNSYRRKLIQILIQILKNVKALSPHRRAQILQIAIIPQQPLSVLTQPFRVFEGVPQGQAGWPLSHPHSSTRIAVDIHPVTFETEESQGLPIKIGVRGGETDVILSAFVENTVIQVEEVETR